MPADFRSLAFLVWGLGGVEDLQADRLVRFSAAPYRTVFLSGAISFTGYPPWVPASSMKESSINTSALTARCDSAAACALPGHHYEL